MSQIARVYGTFFTEVLLEAEKEARSIMNDWSEPPRDPKQGHHIINKGVINIYEDTIRWFVRNFRYSFIFDGLSYDDLKRRNMIVDDEEEEASDFLVVNNPLSPELKEFIKETTAFRNNRDYNSKNAEDFGRAKIILTFCVNSLMLEIYYVLNEEMVNNPVLHFKNLLLDLRDIIAENFFPSPAEYKYVDYDALKFWIADNGNREEPKFNDCKKAVREMLENIACEQTADITPLVFKWGKGAFSISKALSPA